MVRLYYDLFCRDAPWHVSNVILLRDVETHHGASVLRFVVKTQDFASQLKKMNSKYVLQMGNTILNPDASQLENVVFLRERN